MPRLRRRGESSEVHPLHVTGYGHGFAAQGAGRQSVPPTTSRSPHMKLKPIIFLGIAGGVVAVVRKRSGQASELASKAYDAAPQQVKDAAGQAAEKASDLAQQAKDAAPEPVQQAVDQAAEKVSGGDSATGGDADETRRYSAPAEAGAQPPVESGGPPSDDPQATVARSVPQDPTDLATPPANLPDDVVVPATSTDDPAVQEAEAAAAADAANIGGGNDTPRQS